MVKKIQKHVGSPSKNIETKTHRIDSKQFNEGNSLTVRKGHQSDRHAVSPRKKEKKKVANLDYASPNALKTKKNWTNTSTRKRKLTLQSEVKSPKKLNKSNPIC